MRERRPFAFSESDLSRQVMVGHHRVIAGFLNAEYRHVGYLLPSVLKSVRFGGFAPLYRRPASHEGKDIGGLVCAAHRRKNKGFPTLKHTLDFGDRKRAAVKKQPAQKGGLIQVICYPASPETVDITGFFEKFCIAIRHQKKRDILSDVSFLLVRENQGRQRRPLTWHPTPGDKKGDGKGRLLFCLYAINRRGTRLFRRWDPFPVCYSDLWYHRGRRPAY